MEDLVKRNGDDFGARASVRFDKRDLAEERFGVVLIEAEETKVFSGWRARDQEKLFRSVAEGVNGYALQALLDCLDRHGPAPARWGYPGPGRAGAKGWKWAAVRLETGEVAEQLGAVGLKVP